jgi:hypothetical protein
MRFRVAADAAIRYLVDKVHGLGGLIIVDRNGTCARAHSPPGMLTGTAENTDDIAASICYRRAGSIDGTRAHRDARLRNARDDFCTRARHSLCPAGYFDVR